MNVQREQQLIRLITGARGCLANWAPRAPLPSLKQMEAVVEVEFARGNLERVTLHAPTYNADRRLYLRPLGLSYPAQ